MKYLLLGLTYTVLICSCATLTSEEIARLSFQAVDGVSQEYAFELEEGEDVHFWTEIDIEFDDELSIGFYCDIWIDSTRIGQVKLDVFETNPTFGEISTNVGNHNTRILTGLMGKYKATESGHYTFKAIIADNGNETLQIEKAVLIFKK